MSDTANKILDVALNLIQTRGFNAFSYNDIATVLNIKKASIHYHFAGKSDLGVAVVRRYADTFAQAMEHANGQGLNSWQLLDSYLVPYRQFSRSDDRICLCGALAGEFLALPKAMQEEVTLFFDINQQWLERLFRNGKRKDEFHFGGSAKKEARLAFSALQGALLVQRTIGNTRQLDDVIAVIKYGLKAQ